MHNQAKKLMNCSKYWIMSKSLISGEMEMKVVIAVALSKMMDTRSWQIE